MARMGGAIDVVVWYLSEDDPKKNTALRLKKHKKARLVEKAEQVPKHAVLLNPFAKKAISKEDLRDMRKYGLVAVDCSWRQAEPAFKKLLGRTRSRALPLLWAGNPTKWGKPATLSTAEALAAALHIAGEPIQARQLLGALPFADQFWTLNENPLADYAAAEDSKGVVAAQEFYLDEDEEMVPDNSEE